MEEELQKPCIPYTVGQTFHVQSHITPSPTPVTWGYCINDQDGRNERTLFSPHDRCVRNPPLAGELGSRVLDLTVLSPIRVGDYNSAQIFLAEVSDDQSIPEIKKSVVAKVYDPLYFNDEDGYINPFKCVDNHYTHEVHTYNLFSDFQGGLVPEFYGSFSLDLSEPGSDARTVRLILIEHIPGSSMLQASPADYSQQYRQQIMKCVIDFESTAYHRHIALTDLSPRNVMLLDPACYPQRKTVFLDFATTLFSRTFGGELDNDMVPGEYISPLLRWNQSMVREFSDWVDWEFRPWVEAEYAHEAAHITPEMIDKFCPIYGTEVRIGK
ncbi:hypothetical protein BDV25DRAFT_152231 [Aspergillus avenaceus]|uniref:Protein kinase domain-containing protein n=1 Tax=Aspergillus avenaceus TaxID=36643 RepID=A0A5N6TZE3_ASPAV|nr:hypothetical protein BDV25DRAFT_152231 [Aspergillus avenaceus]